MAANFPAFSLSSALCAALLALTATGAQAVDAGVSDSEIRIGASAVLPVVVSTDAKLFTPRLTMDSTWPNRLKTAKS